MLEIIPFILGPVETNSYLVANTGTSQAVVIDPAWDGHQIAQEAQNRGWQIESIWLTHAHFDHIGGSAGVIDNTNPPPTVSIHPADLPLWNLEGGAPLFGFHIDLGPKPSVELANRMILHLGNSVFEVRHLPGHTPGHVIFICHEEKITFVGDVIFQGSIGRTDLVGGDYNRLINGILSEVFSLPDDTVLYPGHGPVTTVGDEKRTNPFFKLG